MSKTNGSNSAIVAIYPTHTAAEAAVRELSESGYDMKSLSIIGGGHHTDEQVVGYYNTADRMMAWGAIGAFWGAISGLLFGPSFFLVPRVGPFYIFAPLIGCILGALEGAVIIGGLSAFGAALFSIGIPKDTILRYESILKNGKFLLITHGDSQQVVRAKDILSATTPETLDHHPATIHHGPATIIVTPASKETFPSFGF